MAAKRKFNQISAGWNVSISAILILVSLLIVLPLILVVIISFTSADSIVMNGYSFFPSEYSLAAYKNLAKTGTQILNSYKVTIFYSFVGTFLSLFVMSMFAYVLAQKRFPLRRFLTVFTFITMLFSGGLVPSYILNVRYLHLDNTIWVLILPGLVNAFHIIILRTFIQTSIPDSLFEAAIIDGATDYSIYFRIVLPLSKAGLATIGLFGLVGRWNNWFTGMLYIDNPKLVPLQTLLQKIQRNIEFIKSNAEFADTQAGLELLRSMPTESTRMAITVIAVVPILFAYPFFQRYFIKGLTIGSVKG
ncbi:MAG: carbohydrate ABC transporter permease [Clostridia bacterium]|nr:carbohydrate ABC transporter permease [Clostridia bacterium]MDD4680500.1 carbohydrate ABC transporter permease [Clostridia bacterium]